MSRYIGIVSGHINNVADALALYRNALTLYRAALTLQRIAKFNSLQIKEMLY
ncbi:hypothetical protein [Nostoc sp.]|uniref:hypothetical protein n=1 Tax=Nostoc sp. TaxID=1180 RepID=UPI002FF8D948